MKRSSVFQLIALQSILFATAAIPSKADFVGWQLSTWEPAAGSPVQTGGTGSVGSGGSGTYPPSPFIINSNAALTQSGTGHASAEYTISDLVHYEWFGIGPPTATFSVNVHSVNATASFSATAVGSVLGNISGSVGTTPSSISASVTASQTNPSPAASSPAAMNYVFSPNGAFIDTWQVTSSSKASISVIYGTGSGTGSASSTISFDKPVYP